MNLRRLLALLTLALLALPLAACGNKEETITFGETEGAYLDVGDLTYQVQISRILNPNDNEDKSYLVDVPASEADLAPDEAWFAVFMLVQNLEDEPSEAATDFEIVDTEENVYRPITIGPENVFAYRGGTVEAGSTLPEPDTAARNNPSVNGALLLFKVKQDSFANRPLELEIRAEGAEPSEAAVDLDV
ncbi:MAG TPA: hypothetical protein VFR97_13355 [Capillimicrobium sp.]|nr:hypothetical protein [Capillimicrobium sp.]